MTQSLATQYLNGLRTPEARAAACLTRKKNRVRRARLGGLQVNPKKTMRQVQELMAAGWGAAEISREVGVTRNTVWRLHRGMGTFVLYDTAKSVNELWERRLLPSWESAETVAGQISDLLESGWTYTNMARAVGLARTTLRRISDGEFRRVHRDTARKIDRLWADYCGDIGRKI